MGGRPHLVTLLLDLLLERGEAVDQVWVIYLAQYRRSQEAFALLEKEFAGSRYGGRPCELRGAPIRTGRQELVDLRGPGEIEIARKGIRELLGRLKQEGRQLHLGLSGGRRLISFVALIEAMQQLTPADRLWHLYASPDLIATAEQTGILHAPPGSDLRLIAVPFVPWVSYFPGLSSLLGRSAEEIGESGLGWLEQAERERCRMVWEALSARQRDVLKGFARGLSRKEVASHLGIAVTTVDSHRDAILAACSLHWDADDGLVLDTRFLERVFGRFLAANG
jgi:CRISPR-associated protein Csx14